MTKLGMSLHALNNSNFFKFIYNFRGQNNISFALIYSEYMEKLKMEHIENIEAGHEEEFPR